MVQDDNFGASRFLGKGDFMQNKFCPDCQAQLELRTEKGTSFYYCVVCGYRESLEKVYPEDEMAFAS